MGFSLQLPPGWFTHKEEKAPYGYAVTLSYPVDNSSSQDFTENQIASIDIGRSDNIESVLEEYLQNPQLLHQRSKAGLEYVHKWHNPLYVAGITKSVYEEVEDFSME